MSGLFGGSKSKQTTTPVDMTPEAFKGLQGPLANALMGLFQGNVPAYTGDNGGNIMNPQTIANPAYTALQQQIAALQPVANTNTTAPAGAASGYRPGNREDRFHVKQLQGMLDITGGSGGTVGANGNPQLQALMAQLAGTSPTVANPDYKPALTNEQLVAPMTAQQNSLLAQIVQAAQAGSPNYAASQNMLGSTINGQYLQPGSNPFLSAAIEAAQRPLVEQFNQSIVPNLLSRFAAAGQTVQGAGSSAFANQANLAASQQAKALGDVATNMSYQNYNAERDRQMQAISEASKISTEELNRTMSAFQAAALPQMIQDLGIERGIEQFNQRVNTLLAALQMASGVAQPTIASQGTITQKQGGDLGSLVVAALMGDYNNGS